MKLITLTNKKDELYFSSIRNAAKFLDVNETKIICNHKVKGWEVDLTDDEIHYVPINQIDKALKVNYIF